MISSVNRERLEVGESLGQDSLRPVCTPHCCVPLVARAGVGEHQGQQCTAGVQALPLTSHAICSKSHIQTIALGTWVSLLAKNREDNSFALLTPYLYQGPNEISREVFK